MTFAGKVGVVTGAAGGMGLNIARDLIAAGANVTMLDIEASVQLDDPKARARGGPPVSRSAGWAPRKIRRTPACSCCPTRPLSLPEPSSLSMAASPPCRDLAAGAGVGPTRAMGARSVEFEGFGRGL